MPKKVAAAVAVAALAVVGGAVALASPANATTSAMTTYYVSPSGADTNVGTDASHPCRTIAKAKTAVEAELAGLSVVNGVRQMSGDIAVKIREGNYFLSAPIALTEADSGSNGHQVVFQNYDEGAVPEHPQIIGGKQVAEWTLCSSAACGGSRNTTVQQANNVTGGVSWNTSTDPSTSSTPTVPNGDAGAFYNLMGNGQQTTAVGSVAAVNGPGKWYLDSSTHVLYYWPRSTSISTAAIYVPTVLDIFRVVGGASPVQNVTISGLSLELTDYVKSFLAAPDNQAELEYNKHGLVYLENTANVTVTNNRLVAAGLSGIWLNKYAQNNVISGNWVQGSGLNAIYLTGWVIGQGGFANATDAYVNKHNTITDNYVTNSDNLAVGSAFASVGSWRGSGIQLYQSGDNTISHNTISGGPRYGIS